MHKVANFGPVAALTIALTVLVSGAASAQNNRSFVSGKGSDSNPCSLADPCRSFAQALSQTNPGGEITVLDSAGYGTLTITQSVTITNPGGVEAGVTAASGASAITIEASSPATVTLRGLTLEGGGVGQNGIFLASALPAIGGAGGTLNIIDCVVKDFAGSGIAIEPISGSGPAPSISLVITNTLALNNATNGIELMPGNINLYVSIDHSNISGNGTGITTGTVLGQVQGTLSESHVNNNTSDGINIGLASIIYMENSTAQFTVNGNDVAVGTVTSKSLTITNNSTINILTINGGSPAAVFSDGTNLIGNVVGGSLIKESLQ